jgi:hypothetical protein
MPREVEDGIQVIDQFPVFDNDGYSKKSGLLAGNFSAEVFRNAVLDLSVTVTISEIGVTGEYKVLWTPPLGNLGYYNVQVINDFNKEIWFGTYQVVNRLLQDMVQQILNQVNTLNTDRIRGLLHENAIVDNQVYDTANQLLSARVRVFDDPGNVPSTPGGSEIIGLLHEYSVEAAYSAPAQLEKYILKRVL